MDCEIPHQPFDSFTRRSQSFRKDRCQNILYKAVLEHFMELRDIAPLLLASKSFQNSSFGANFLVNFVVDECTIRLLSSVLSPSSCFSLQFAPRLYIQQSWMDAGTVKQSISNFVSQLVSTKYLRLSLRSLTLHSFTCEHVTCFFGTSSNTWTQLQELCLDSSELNDSVLELISAKALQLCTVNLSESSGFTDSGLEHLSKLSSMTSLNLACCGDVTDAGLEHIAKLDGITSLDLSYCVNITDAGLEHISQLSSMTSLSLHGCKAITDAGLQLLSTLSDINVLRVACCDNITTEGIAKFKGKHPNCKID